MQLKLANQTWQYKVRNRKGHQVRQELIIAFLTGGLVMGGTTAGVGYLVMSGTSAENARLQSVVKKQEKRLKKLNTTQTDLQTELTSLKDQQDQGYQQTIDSLMTAKENADIDSLYQMGAKALAAKDAPSAFYSLSKVHEQNPKFKEIDKLFPAAKKAYDQHQQTELEARLKAAYAKGLDMQASNQLAQAQASFQQVVNLKADYKDAKVRLANVSRYLAVRGQTRELEQKKQWLEATYKLGVTQQSLGRFAAARDAFAQIKQYAPQYKDSAKRLSLVQAKLPKTAPQLPNQMAAGARQKCYDLGTVYGSCTKNPQSPACTQVQNTPLSAECKNNPEFLKGYQSVASGGGAAMPEEALPERNPNEELKGFADFLKGL